MGDDNHRTTSLDPIQTALNLLRRHSIKRCRRFVQENDRRILQEHTRNCDTLLLTARKRSGLTAETRRERHDFIIDERTASRILHLLTSRRRTTVTDILLNRTVENMILLQHKTDVISQVARVPLPQIHTVQENLTAVRHIELVQEIHNRALAGTRETNQSRDLTRTDMHVYMVQSLRPGGVGEIHTANLKLATDRLWPIRTRGLALIVRIQYVKETLRIDQRIVHLVKDPLQLRDGSRDVRKQHHMIHDLADGHARIAREHQIGSEDDDQHRAHLTDKTLQTVIAEGSLANQHLVVRESRLQLPLLLTLNLLAVEGLDYADALDDIHHAVALLLTIHPHVTTPSLQLVRLRNGNPDVNGHDEKGCQTHPYIRRKHEDEGQDGTGEEGQEIYEEVLHRRGQTAHTLVYTRLEFACLIVGH